MNKLNLNLQPKEYNPNLQPKGSWAETCADKPGAGMHVVISTKYLDEGGGKGVCSTSPYGPKPLCRHWAAPSTTRTRRTTLQAMTAGC